MENDKFHLSDSIKDFLFYGPEDISSIRNTNNGTDDNLNLIGKYYFEYLRNQTNNLKHEISSFNDSTNDIKQRLKITLEKVQQIKSKFDSLQIVPLLKHYNYQQNKLLLFQLGNLIEKLQSVEYKDIPTKAIEIKLQAPKVIPNNSIIKTKLIEVVNNIRNQQIIYFHDKFEKHLAIESNSSDNLHPGTNLQLWINFLVDAREWLLSFTCISLLPVVLTESKILFNQRYEEIIDEALTPLWARFHFHLSLTRESVVFTSSDTNLQSSDSNLQSSDNNLQSSVPLPSHTLEQLLWAFQYARNYIDMVINLSDEINVSDFLQKLHPNDYKKVARKYIIEKSIRIMRAHIADVFVKYFSKFTDEFIKIFVEQIFNLDSYLNTWESYQTINICRVLYDAKPFHSRWLLIERTQWIDLLKPYFKNIKDTYSFEFGVDLNVLDITPLSRDMSNITTTVNESTNKTAGVTELKCYKGIYHTMKFFILATQRYQYLPKESQDIVSAIILEPLLSLCVGMFLFKTKIDPSLYAISNKSSYSLSELASSEMINKYKRNRTYPMELQNFLSSVQYVQKCLKHASYPSLFISNRDRYEDTWKILVEWIPKRAIFDHEYRPNGLFSPLKLLQASLDTITWKDYFESKSSSVISFSSKKNKGNLKDNDIHGSSHHHVHGLMGDNIELARAQMLTLSRVLEKQFQNNVLKL